MGGSVSINTVPHDPAVAEEVGKLKAELLVVEGQLGQVTEENARRAKEGAAVLDQKKNALNELIATEKNRRQGALHQIAAQQQKLKLLEAFKKRLQSELNVAKLHKEEMMKRLAA